MTKDIAPVSGTMLLLLIYSFDLCETVYRIINNHYLKMTRRDRIIVLYYEKIYTYSNY